MPCWLRKLPLVPREWGLQHIGHISYLWEHARHSVYAEDYDDLSSFLNVLKDTTRIREFVTIMKKSFKRCEREAGVELG